MRERRRQAQVLGRSNAATNDAHFHAGCMLYWAEGTKGRNSVQLANTDVALVAFFVRWLQAWFPVERDQILINVNCFLNNGLALGEIEAWWLDQLGLPGASLRKAIVNTPGGSSRGLHRRHSYGTAHVTLHSTFVLQAIYGAIQEITGIDRPEWLDIGVTVRGVG